MIKNPRLLSSYVVSGCCTTLISDILRIVTCLISELAKNNKANKNG